MKKIIFCLISLTVLITSCKKKQDPFLIGKQHIGLLTDTTQIKDLKQVFSKDSIVNLINGDEFTGSVGDIKIFEKSGKLLLALTPREPLDSTSVIKSIQVFDPRYKTDKNITTLSTFKDIEANYKISRINNLINSIVISIDGINAAFTIDKKELPANIRFDMNINIEAAQIPDHAKVKYFFLNWNNL